MHTVILVADNSNFKMHYHITFTSFFLSLDDHNIWNVKGFLFELFNFPDEKEECEIIFPLPNNYNRIAVLYYSPTSPYGFGPSIEYLMVICQLAT